jgi:Domain of unknown function (DUF5602)
MKKFFILATLFVATISFMSCEKDDNKTPTPVDNSYNYGTSVKLADGTAKSFIKHDAAGVPLEIGVAISEAAMNNLPHSGGDLVLDLPASHAKMPYKFVYLNYVHGGHEPHGVYTKDHFDVHFYMVPNSVRESITSDKDPRLMKFPIADKIPANYTFAGLVPFMGAHWADTTSAEFKGQPFTATMIYGSLDGEMIFHEPMVTVEHLKKQENKMFPIKRPLKVTTPGYYPAEYWTRYNATLKQYEVVLKNMVQK